MKYCDAYQLMSFLVEEFINSQRKSDLEIEAEKVNSLSEVLFAKGVDNDFGYYAFVNIAEENKNLLEISDSMMVIKYEYFSSGRRFMNWDSKRELMDLLKTEWSKL